MVGGARYLRGPISWSPDGDTLLFTGIEAQRVALYRVGKDGSGLRQLVRLPARDKGALDSYGWSPDGRALLYVRWLRIGRWDDGVGPAVLKTLPAQGGAARTVLRSDLIVSAAWSPDGRLIAYLKDCWPAERQGDACRLGMANPRTRKQRDLPTVAPPPFTDDKNLSYAWRSPQQTIIYAYSSPTIYELSPTRRTTRTVTRLPCPWPTCDAATIAIEAISADGSYAVATAGFEKKDPLSIVRRSYLVNLRTGSHRRIPTLATSEPEWPLASEAVVYLPR